VRLAACFALLSSLVVSSAAAQSGVSPPPAFELGTSTVQNRHLEVRCSGPERCTIALDFDVVAAGPTVIRAHGGDSVHIDGRERREHELAEGGSAHVRVEAERDLRARYREDDPLFLLADALWARHLLLAPRSTRLTSARYDDEGMRWEPFSSARFAGPLAVDAQLGEHVWLAVDQRRIDGVHHIPDGYVIELAAREAPEPAYQWVRSGGPVLGLGVYSDPDRDRVAGRAAYELGITDWMIASAAVESDFERRVMFSLMLEGATPAMLWVYVLGTVSASAGIGAVLEISPEGARGAVRFVSCIQAAPIGMQITADYYPEDGELVTAVMGRLSL
jgi:hypothetical protein